MTELILIVILIVTTVVFFIILLGAIKNNDEHLKIDKELLHLRSMQKRTEFSDEIFQGINSFFRRIIDSKRVMDFKQKQYFLKKSIEILESLQDSKVSEEEIINLFKTLEDEIKPL
jgi:hypothetical protein